MKTLRSRYWLSTAGQLLVGLYYLCYASFFATQRASWRTTASSSRVMFRHSSEALLQGLPKAHYPC